MGLTFKEDCPDLRNTRVADIIQELKVFNVRVDVYDPWVNPEESEKKYAITPQTQLENGLYDGVVLAVAHRQFREMDVTEIRQLGKRNHVLYDLKYILGREKADLRL